MPGLYNFTWDFTSLKHIILPLLRSSFLTIDEIQKNLRKSGIIDKRYQNEDRDSGLLFSRSLVDSINKREKSRKK